MISVFIEIASSPIIIFQVYADHEILDGSSQRQVSMGEVMDTGSWRLSRQLPVSIKSLTATLSSRGAQQVIFYLRD